MIRNLVVAAAVAASAFILPQTAEAKTNIYIGIGGGCVGNPYACDYPPGWQGHGDYDDYEPGYDDDADYAYRPRQLYRPRYVRDLAIRDSLTCKGARFMLEERGWRNVRPRDCRGTSYTFLASRRGVVSVVRVNSYSGRITSIRRLSY